MDSEDADAQNTAVDSENRMQVDDLQKRPFRRNSRLLATFPWFTSLPMVETDLAELLPEGDLYVAFFYKSKIITFFYYPLFPRWYSIWPNLSIVLTLF